MIKNYKTLDLENEEDIRKWKKSPKLTDQMN